MIALPNAGRWQLGLTAVLLPVTLAVVGCQDPNAADKPEGQSWWEQAFDLGWLEPTRKSDERWTIRCLRIPSGGVPDHARRCEYFADMLRLVQQLDPDQIRVESGAGGSTLFYGEYHRIASPKSGQMHFPPELRRDITLIRQLSLNRAAPFAHAIPELITDATVEGVEQWHVSNATGTYTLQIALFYNTETFTERMRAAEEYVRILRDRDLPAYYTHEAARSIVFVGDFTDEDLTETPRGPMYGPRVQQLITQDDGEFQYMTENGHYVKRRGPDGRMGRPPSFLVEVSREKPTDTWEEY